MRFRLRGGRNSFLFFSACYNKSIINGIAHAQ